MGPARQVLPLDVRASPVVWGSALGVTTTPGPKHICDTTWATLPGWLATAWPVIEATNVGGYTTQATLQTAKCPCDSREPHRSDDRACQPEAKRLAEVHSSMHCNICCMHAGATLVCCHCMRLQRPPPLRPPCHSTLFKSYNSITFKRQALHCMASAQPYPKHMQ